MTDLKERLAGRVPAPFLEALVLLVPDAEAGDSPGQTVYFPCHDPEALEFGNRLFWTSPGSRPAMPYELEVQIAPGTMRVEGTWLGPDPLGGVAVPERRVWLPDDSAFEISGVIRQPGDDGGAGRGHA